MSRTLAIALSRDQSTDCARVFEFHVVHLFRIGLLDQSIESLWRARDFKGDLQGPPHFRSGASRTQSSLPTRWRRETAYGFKFPMYTWASHVSVMVVTKS